MKNKITINNIFVKRLGLIMTSKSVPSKVQARASYLADLCKVSTQAARKWLDGKGMPDFENMMLIASNFSVTTSYLLGEINIKNIGCSEGNSLFRNSAKNGVITIPISENMFYDEFQVGDEALCHPTNTITHDGDIYLLQSSQKKFFRRLGRDAQGSLVVAHEEGGKDVITTYTDEAIIELFLSSLTGRVEAVLRKIK